MHVGHLHTCLSHLLHDPDSIRQNYSVSDTMKLQYCDWKKQAEIRIEIDKDNSGHTKASPAYQTYTSDELLKAISTDMSDLFEPSSCSC